MQQQFNIRNPKGEKYNETFEIAKNSFIDPIEHNPIYSLAEVKKDGEVESLDSVNWFSFNTTTISFVWNFSLAF